jgi:dethiobiotin synthetase
MTHKNHTGRRRVARNSSYDPVREGKPIPIIFVTGTDTGAGKTLLTGLLVHHLRQNGCHALAMKPFCCGSAHDVDLLSRMQDGELSRKEINPFYFEEPIAPLVAARKYRRRTPLADVVARIRDVQKRCECLVIEGVGGLMTPLGENFFAGDLMASLGCHVVVAARNKLGVINHTLLTARGLQCYGIRRIKVALLGCSGGDLSVQTNATILAELVCPVRVVSLSFLGARAGTERVLKKEYRKVKKTLALVADFATFSPLFNTSSTSLSEK